MIITYFAHVTNKNRENDEDILQALKKLGHKVYAIDDRNFDHQKVVDTANKSDLFLFHKGGINEDSLLEQEVTLMNLQNMLKDIKCKKAFWYVDKVYQGRERWISAIYSLVNAGFLVDETFLRRRKYPNLYSLKQGCSIKPLKGKKNPIYECDIAYIGSVYSEPRKMFVKEMSKRYGDKFRVYTDVHGQDFADLCVSAKMIISPDYPIDDFYWGDRIYRVCAAGGLMVHPNSYGLKDQGFKSGYNFIGYTDWCDLTEIIDYFLSDKMKKVRKEIAKRGKELVVEKYNYVELCKKLLSKI